VLKHYPLAAEQRWLTAFPEAADGAEGEAHKMAPDEDKVIAARSNREVQARFAPLAVAPCDVLVPPVAPGQCRAAYSRVLTERAQITAKFNAMTKTPQTG
jgi:hypothetical protein